MLQMLGQSAVKPSLTKQPAFASVSVGSDSFHRLKPSLIFKGIYELFDEWVPRMARRTIQIAPGIFSKVVPLGLYNPASYSADNILTILDGNKEYKYGVTGHDADLLKETMGKINQTLARGVQMEIDAVCGESEQLQQQFMERVQRPRGGICTFLIRKRANGMYGSNMRIPYQGLEWTSLHAFTF